MGGRKGGGADVWGEQVLSLSIYIMLGNGGFFLSFFLFFELSRTVGGKGKGVRRGMIAERSKRENEV